MKYDKLVRDYVPDRIREKGGTPIVHIASPEEYWEKLQEKFMEEFREFLESKSLEELADLYEVLDAIVEHEGFGIEELKKVRRQKAVARGRFQRKIILEEA